MNYSKTNAFTHPDPEVDYGRGDFGAKRLLRAWHRQGAPRSEPTDTAIAGEWDRLIDALGWPR